MIGEGFGALLGVMGGKEVEKPYRGLIASLCVDAVVVCGFLRVK